MSTVTVVATVEASNVPPRVRLDVTDTGSPNLFATTVTRLDPTGAIVPVRTSDGNPLTLTTSGADRVGLLYDYEMPYGAGVTYSTVESPTVLSAEVTVPEERPWLNHPGVPELSQPITIARIGPRSRRAQRGVFYPMGRKYPVTQTDGSRKAAEFELVLHTMTDDEHADLEALLEDSSVLLLNLPYTKAWGVNPEYVSVGDLSEARISVLAEPWRTWSLPCTVVDRPEGGSQAERSYVDLLSFSSYSTMQSNYATYAALLSGP